MKNFPLPSLIACCLWLGVVSALPSAEKIEHIKLKAPAADFAMAPETGIVGAVFAGSNEAVFYPKLASQASIADPVTVTVGRQPVAIAFKSLGDKSYFIVACEEGNELTVIDAVTLKAVKSIPVEISKPNFLSASLNKNDPYIYYCGSSHSPSGFVLGRVSLTDFKDFGPLSRTGVFHLTEATISADGTMLYPRSRNASPSGFAVVSISESADPAKPTLRELYRKHESSEFYVADPFGQFIVSGKQLFSPDLRKPVATLKMSPLLVSANRPILAGVESNLLSIVSRNSFTGLTALRLPFTTQKPKKDPFMLGGKDHQQPRVLESHKDSALIVCHGANIAVVPDASLKFDREAFLVVNVEGSGEFSVGREQSIQLTPKDPKAVLKLSKAPEGVALKDSRLSWTPKSGQVGAHSITLEVKAGEVSTPLLLDWLVRYPSVNLGMLTNRLAVDDAGEFAAVLEQTTPFAPIGQQAQSRVKLVDLKALKIVGSATVATGATEIGIDAHHVYVNSFNSDVFYALDRKDLTKSRRMFVQGRRVQSFIPIADRLLVVTTILGNTMLLRTPSLEQAEAGDFGLGTHRLPTQRTSFQPHVPEPIRDGWIHEGILYDRELKKLRAAVWPQGFWQVVERGLQPTDSTGRMFRRPFESGTTQDFNWLDHWAVYVQHTTLMRGQQIIGGLKPKDKNDFHREGAAILPDQPAAVWVGMAQDGFQPDGGSRWRVAMVYCDLVSGLAKETLTLLDEPVPFGRDLGNAEVKVVARPGRMVAIVNDQLFAIPTPMLDKIKFPKPIHASALPAVQVLDAKELKVPLAGFTDTGTPLEVIMRKEERGVDVAKDKQHLLLDGKQIIAGFHERLVEHLATHGADAVTNQAFKSSDERLDAYLKNASIRFEKIVGRKPNGIPMWLPLDFTVKNKDLQTLDITFGVMVEVPEEPVRKAAKVAFEKSRPKPPPVVRDNPQVGNLLAEQEALKKRVTELEGKLDQMNQKLDVLADLLRGKGKK